MFTSTAVTSDLIEHTESFWWLVLNSGTCWPLKTKCRDTFGLSAAGSLTSTCPSWAGTQTGTQRSACQSVVTEGRTECLEVCAEDASRFSRKKNYTFSDGKSDLFSDQGDLMYGIEFVTVHLKANWLSNWVCSAMNLCCFTLPCQLFLTEELASDWFCVWFEGSSFKFQPIDAGYYLP